MTPETYEEWLMELPWFSYTLLEKYSCECRQGHGYPPGLALMILSAGETYGACTIYFEVN